MSDGREAEADRTAAAVRRSWWPGWIWAVPIAALLVLGWVVLRAVTSGGEEIRINFTDAHGLKPKNANVIYRGLKIGKVEDVALTKDRKAVAVTAEIDDSAKEFLRAGTVFWLRGAEPDFSNLASLTAILSGPDIIMEPGPGKRTKEFTGVARRPLVTGGASEAAQIYSVSLSGAVGELKEGQPVKLRGFPLGEVKRIGFRYDAKSGEIETPVTIALYPSLFPIANGDAPGGSAAFQAAIAQLVAAGLRARLERDPPVIGGYQIALDIVSDGSRATLTARNGVPEIPSAPAAGISSLAARLGKVPIDQIAQNVLDATHHLDALISAPELKDSIAQLDASLKQIDQTTRKAGPEITKLVAALHKTAGQLDDATQAANAMLSSSANQNGLPQAVREISEAARSMRDLSDYLERHPEALIQGKGEE